MKVFAKLCDIGDASKGSLSSYAYILMVIYYLQRTAPPVVPVLQEVGFQYNVPVSGIHCSLLFQLYEGEQPKQLVEGCNAWFYDDLKSLHRVWPHVGKNKQSLGELWIGLLRFYTETFSFRDSVVSIRRLATLTRFEKLWTANRCIAVEDPFDLDHNLGAGLSSRMNVFIQKALQNGRMHFGTPLSRLPAGYQSLADYMFDPKILTAGPPPADRNCRLCGKIGHWRKECPERERSHAHKNTRSESQERENPPGRPIKKTNGTEIGEKKSASEKQNGVKTQASNPRDAGRKPSQKAATSSLANRSKSVEEQEQVREEVRKRNDAMQQTKTSRSDTNHAAAKHRVRVRVLNTQLLRSLTSTTPVCVFRQSSTTASTAEQRTRGRETR